MQKERIFLPRYGKKLKNSLKSKDKFLNGLKNRKKFLNGLESRNKFLKGLKIRDKASISSLAGSRD
jgi:hypothetical protein